MGYVYDAMGNLTQKTMPGATVSYSYDSLNRLTGKTYNPAGTPAPPSGVFTFLRWISKPPSGIQVSTSPVPLFM